MTDLNLEAKKNEIELALRDIGVFVDEAQWHDPLGDMQAGMDEEDRADFLERYGAEKRAYVLAMDCFVSQVAFLDRVQNPDQWDIDTDFRMMTSGLKEDAFETKRQEMLKRIAEGKSPLGSDDDDADA